MPDIQEKTYRARDIRGYDRDKFFEGNARSARYIETVPPCWMCSTTATGTQRTKEHVFPRWLTKHFDRDSLTFSPIRSTILMSGEQRGPMPSTAMTLGGVCAHCNNGWMSTLEANVESILFERSGVLGVREVEQLARWFTKTACVLNLSQGYPLLWPSHVRHRLAVGIPSNVRVNVFRSDRSDVGWVMHRNTILQVPDDFSLREFQLTGDLSLISYLKVGNLVGIVLIVPGDFAHCKRISLPGTPIWDGWNGVPVDLLGLPEGHADEMHLPLDLSDPSPFYVHPSFSGPIYKPPLHMVTKDDLDDPVRLARLLGYELQ